MRNQPHTHRSFRAWRPWLRLSGRFTLGPQRAFLLALLVAGMSAWAPLPTLGSTYYVRSGGSDVNDGLSEGTAMLTITNAVVTANADNSATTHTIDIGPGTFTSPGAGAKPNKPMMFRGAGTSSTTLTNLPGKHFDFLSTLTADDCTDYSQTFIFKDFAFAGGGDTLVQFDSGNGNDYITFDNVSLAGYGNYGYGFWLNFTASSIGGDYWKFKNFVAMNMSTGGEALFARHSGSARVQLTGWVFDGCTISNNSTFLWREAGANRHYADGWTLKNSTWSRNTATAPRGSFEMNNCTDRDILGINLIDTCTIEDNNGYGIYAPRLGANACLIIKDSTIRDTTAGATQRTNVYVTLTTNSMPVGRIRVADSHFGGTEGTNQYGLFISDEGATQTHPLLLANVNFHNCETGVHITSSTYLYVNPEDTGTTIDLGKTLVSGGQVILVGDCNTNGIPAPADPADLALTNNVDIVDGTATWAQGDVNCDGNFDDADRAILRVGIPSKPAGFALEPVSRTVLENQPVTFSVVVTGTPPRYVQWQRDSNNIPDATNLTYSIPAVPVTDNGATFRVIVTNAYAEVISSNAILTVIRDETAPTVVAVTTERTARNLTNVTVRFSEPVGASSAQTPGNYVLNGGALTTYSAVLQPDLVTVLLTIDPLTPDAFHTLTISNVTDRADIPNVMTATNWIVLGPPTSLPPVIQVRFEEGSGIAATNSGTAGGTLTLSAPVPTWAANVPAGFGGVSSGVSSVDFGTTTGNYYVESPTNYPQLAGLTKFTIAGWVNNRLAAEGAGGNRVVTWINNGGNGVDLVYRSDGSLQMGINQWPDAGGTPAQPRSTAGKITADANAGATNWVFFAVTYDSTLASNHVKFYFGSNTNDATLDVARDYSRGAVGTSINLLCIGHFNIATRAGATTRMFRGLIDEVQVLDDALSLAEIQQIQAPRPASPLMTATRATNDLIISWTSPASFQLQYRGNAAQGNWENETTAPEVSGNTNTVRVLITETNRFYRLKSP